MIRILTLTSVFPNSQQPHFAHFMKERIRYLANLCELKVVAPLPYSPPFKHLNKRWYSFSQVPSVETIDGLEISHPRYFMTPKIGMSYYGYSYYVALLPFLQKLRKCFPFDAIDAHWAYPDGFAAVRIAKRLNIPVCLTLRGTDVNKYMKMRVIRRLILNTLHLADRIITVSHVMRDKLLESGVPKEKIAVIPNGVDKSKFFYCDQTTARNKLGLPLDKKIILHVANLVKVKRQDLLLHSVAEIARVRGDIGCYILGQGSEEARLRSLSKQLCLEEVVTFVGQIPNSQLSLWYNAADVFCLTSKAEGCPNVLLESLGCGLPVVATSVGGIPEIVNGHAGSGMLVDTGDVETLSRILSDSLEKAWDRELIARNHSHRTWGIIASEILENIKAII